ncbi:MAG: putative metal-binding motif-containing protein [Myxococcales bacterium]|nr:putative metal-binding motif-containing protein [Myxococcales bacterium]
MKYQRLIYITGAAMLASCSVLVSPDTSRLNGGADGGAQPVDVPAQTDTGPRPDDAVTPVDTGPAGDDVPRVDAPTGDTPTGDTPIASDVPTGDDVPVLVDTMPPSDVPTSRCEGVCDDGIACTADRCDESTGRCVFTADNAACPAMNVCDVAMRGCVRIDCTNDTQCSDGDLCNGAERCVSNRCVAGTAVTCNDNIECTADRCDPSTGRCVSTPDNSVCDNGSFCDGAEVCDAARGCRSGPAPNCNDNVPCTVDRCDETMRRCTNTPNPSACPARGPCVAAACHPTMGCTYTAIANYCDSFCVTNATCDVGTGQCRGGGTPRSCSDNSVCTLDSCDPARMMCINAPIDRDGDTFAAARVDGTTCAGGTDCNDNDPRVNPNAVEVCNMVDDNCNGMIDEGNVCGARGDTCAGAIAVDFAGGNAASVSVSMQGVVDNEQGSRCGNGAEVYFRVTAPGNEELILEATATTQNANPVLSLRAGCGTPELACNDDISRSGNAARIFLRPASTATTARTVIVALENRGGGGDAAGFNFRVTRRAGTPPSNCTRQQLLDISAGGTVYGPIATGFGGIHTTGCGSTAPRPEDVLRMNIPNNNYDIRVGLTSAGQVLAVRQGQCGGQGTRELACIRSSATANVRLGQGPAWVMVDGYDDSNTGFYNFFVQTP